MRPHARWKLCYLYVLQTANRLVRPNLAFIIMRFTLVIVISTVIMVLVISGLPSEYISSHNNDTTSNSIFKLNSTYSIQLNSVGQFKQHTYPLKQTIKSIRQQKRAIIHEQLQSYHHNLLEPLMPMRQNHAYSNITKAKLFSLNQNSLKIDSNAKSLTKFIQDGIFWSSDIESLRPKGFTVEDDFQWIRSLQNNSVVRVEAGCGRMLNRLLIFENGNKACARYRKNIDQIQGEFVSFLLSRILNISNVPPSVLVSFESGVEFQRNFQMKSDLMRQAQWETKQVVLTKFVDHLKAAYIPNGLRTSRRRLYPVWADLGHLNTYDIIELVQWSDLIVLDYLTANLDRMLNNMINERWNSQMMDSPAHNLLRQEQSNLLLFLDNESGLFHGYRLLKKYESLHRSLLDIVCVFRQSTVKQLEMLHRLSEKGFASILSVRYRQYVLLNTSTMPALTTAVLPKANLFTLRRRIAQVLKQVAHCRDQFNR